MNNGNAGSIPAPVLTEQGNATGGGTGVLTVPHRLPHNLDIEINALRKGWGEWCEDYMRIDAERQRALACVCWLLDDEHNGYWAEDEHLPEQYREVLVKCRDLVNAKRVQS